VEPEGCTPPVTVRVWMLWPVSGPENLKGRRATRESTVRVAKAAPCRRRRPHRASIFRVLCTWADAVHGWAAGEGGGQGSRNCLPILLFGQAAPGSVNHAHRWADHRCSLQTHHWGRSPTQPRSAASHRIRMGCKPRHRPPRLSPALPPRRAADQCKTLARGLGRSAFSLDREPYTYSRVCVAD
jgi:hypothetical protein